VSRSPLSRSGWLAVLAAGILVAGLAVRLSWPSAVAALDCPPADLRFDGGVAFCAPGSPAAPAPVGPALTLGVKLDLNKVCAEELAVLPGIGPSLSRAIVEARTQRGGAFRSWEEVDEVAGVGPSKLEVLRASAELR
jgi:competence protein ComEA